ncbi:MAG: hypothetical protein FJ290_07180 [Planctomycetes bacterium]|nr:hypothetical protein [Planctomycetota bacterium]
MKALCASCLAALAAMVAAAAAPERTVVLGATSYWWMHHTLKPPVVAVGGRIEPVLRKNAWLDGETPPPPANWQAADFDDSQWLRTMPQGGCQTPYLARQCFRGRFLVADPARVQDLQLTLRYHGGAVVYLNGVELVRHHLPAGATLAEGYPLGAYVAASRDLLAQEGTYIGPGRLAPAPDAEAAKRIASRERRLDDFAIPASALRRGTNVLAIELVRSPYHEVLLETREQAGGRNRHNRFDWYTCQLRGVGLTSSSTAGLAPNAGRPAGFQVWNSDPLAADGSLDYGDPCEALRLLRLVGARGGSFSGKVVAGSSRPIAGLKATASALRGQRGTIPAAAVRVRYGLHWGVEAGFCSGQGTDAIRSPYPRPPAFFGALSDVPPDGAVVPVWVTVSVPRDAPAGRYEGQLRIEAKGETLVSVPIQLDVSDYTLPDPQDYRTWVELIQSPDTLAIEYNVPLWSDAHWEKIAASFHLMRECGARLLYVPAIAQTNLGNAESMIRWVQKGEQQYGWDFSVMDRYLDLAERHLGRPKVVVLQVWEVYMSTRESVGKRFGPELEKRLAASKGGPLVTLLDPATGKAEVQPMPPLAAPGSKAVWKQLIAEVRQRLEKRGLGKALMLGMFTDAMPSREDIQFFHEIAPGVPWVQQGHGRWTQKVYGIAEVGYQASVWGGFRFADGGVQTNQEARPIVQSLYGWKEPRLDALFERNLELDSYPPTRWRFYAETAITGELRGIGRIGADHWPVLRDPRGRRTGRAHDRFAAGAWGGSWINLNLCSSALAPGPDGPLATTRLVALTEGVQECEARVCIERALTDEALKARLGPELARRCQEALDRRLFDMWRALCNYQLGGPFFFGAGAWRWTPGIPGHRWYLGSGWQDESARLFDLAGQAQRATSRP